MNRSRDYRWCSVHRVGHPLAGGDCPEWLDALSVREAVLEQRRQEWRRGKNRNQRYRNCIVCGRRFGGGAPKRGRPQEMCSAACQEIRDNDLRKLRRAGVKTRRKRPAHGLRTRGVLRATPELLDFLGAFPDGWSYETQSAE